MLVDPYSNDEIVDVIAASFAREREALEASFREPGRPVRRLMDCPMADYPFRPWQEPVKPGTPEFVFAPTQPDIGPFAQSLETAILEMPLD